jgi:hypothetical protein
MCAPSTSSTARFTCSYSTARGDETPMPLPPCLRLSFVASRGSIIGIVGAHPHPDTPA